MHYPFHIRTTPCRALVLLLLLVPAVCCSAAWETFDPKVLKGRAEDLWGNKIELSDYAKGTTLIQPFSPSNCGFCLFDGVFVRQNYFANNARFGGSNFLQCLFNPQLDIYSYIKHYRESATPVLTFPPALHGYHQDGFPFLVAFRDGKRVYSGLLAPYEETFRSLQSQLWPGKRVTPIPTSPLFMATRWTEESASTLGIVVYPDGDQTSLEQAKKELEGIGARIKEINMKFDLKWRLPYTAKYESQLTDTDCRMNLRFRGVTERFSLKFLEGDAAPIQITSESVRIGGHEFPKSEVGVSACFPNPRNNERYVVLSLRGSRLKTRVFESWVDYTVYKDGADGKPEILLHGFFGKNGANWRFSPALAFGTAMSNGGCGGGFCRAPSVGSKSLKAHKSDIRMSSWTRTPDGMMRTLGASNCRFPSIAVDPHGTCWVTWEENGDILLASVNGPEPQKKVTVESDTSDSYNPILAHDGSRLWVFYLSNGDGFYRLYARSFDGGRLSDAVPITESEPFDVITPAVAADGKGTMVVAWTEWKPTCRYLRFRSITNGSMGQPKNAAVKKNSNGYVNAWSASLVIDGEGQCWGAWNQHYPAPLGVCSGDMAEEASSVTRIVGSILENENGGYPSIAIDKQGRRWVFWESSAWVDLLENKPQSMLASYYDKESKQWMSPYVLSADTQTFLNQTPKAAVDGNGVIWAVWSGRQSDAAKPWGIYLSRFSNGNWSAPELISQEGVNGRAPGIGIAKDDRVWVTWHAGTGAGMKVKVLRYGK